MSFETLRTALQVWAGAGLLPAGLAYAFVVNALLSALVIGPVLGGLGTLVVTKRMAFFSEAVGHAALTGVAIGILAGEPYTGPYGSLFGFCILFALMVNYLRNRTGLASETLIGVFLSISLALGASLLLVLATRINIHILENVLFGSVLTVDDADLTVLLAVAVPVSLITVTLFNRLLAASVHPSLALARGIGVTALDYLFVLIITIVTVAAVKIVGAILVGALLVVPAAAARVVARSLRGFVGYSVVFATVASLAGILLPVEMDLSVPSGGAIILVAGAIFLAATVGRAVRERSRA
jgi:zinc transport system permease protein